MLTVAGCEVTDAGTHAISASEQPRVEVSSSVGAPIPLPFDNPFPNRWNQSNDGTPFEPCVAYSDEELEHFEINPAVLEDVAQVDGQGTRGCRWNMPNRFDIGQVVTNSQSLDEYRNASLDLRWKPDLVVSGRVVGNFVVNDGQDSTCSTYVQSYGAGVVTNVIASTSSEGKAVDTCKLAVDFTRAYIEKIPE